LEFDNLEQLERMGRFLGRIHAVSACQPFQHRPILTAQTFGYDPLHFLSTTDFIPIHLHDVFLNQAREVLSKVDKLLTSVSSIKAIRLHGDMHPGNVLWDDSGPHILDFDDCMMGPAIQDIWMLLSGHEEQTEIQLDYILRGYSQFHDFNRNELRLIEVLRTLRLLHYTGWLARRWEDPTFPINFPWFDTAGYWDELLQDLRGQNKLLDGLLLV
jgi:Ser/Thr protein kinase RdoA (MazF antagonist)